MIAPLGEVEGDSPKRPPKLNCIAALADDDDKSRVKTLTRIFIEFLVLESEFLEASLS
jgi:hypothetical protein